MEEEEVEPNNTKADNSVANAQCMLSYNEDEASEDDVMPLMVVLNEADGTELRKRESNSRTADRDGENDSRGGKIKRVRRPETHQKVIRKRQYEAGEAYVSTRGKLVPGKQFADKRCGCKMECNSKIRAERRKQIFEHFYSLNWDLKTIFIMRQIEITSKARKYTKAANSRRQHSHVYRLSPNDGANVAVCKTYFKETLQVSDGKIHNVLKMKQTHGGPAPDKRGRHEPHNKTKAGDLEHLHDFVDAAPICTIGYTRKDSDGNKQVLPQINMAGMYRTYKETCGETDRTPLSLFVFRQTLSEKLGVYVHKPQENDCVDEHVRRPT